MSHDLLVQIAYQSVKSENQQQTALTFNLSFNLHHIAVKRKDKEEKNGK